MGYPTPPPAGKPRLRGRIPLRLALIFGVVGLVGAAIGGLLLKNTFDTIHDFTRVSVASGGATVNLDAGTYVGYYEAAGRGINGGTVSVRLAIADASTGEDVDVRLYGQNGTSTSTLTYNSGGKHAEALFSFTLDHSGSYDVQIEDPQSNAPDDADLAFGVSIAGKLVAAVLTLVGGIVFLIPAIVLLIVGLVRRSGHKRELANGGSRLPPPPPGYPPGYGYPPPGYPPPGYPPPNYPPPPSQPPPGSPPPPNQPPLG